MALAEVEQPVHGLLTQSRDHPLAIGVGPQASVGREGDLSAFAGMHLIELSGELGIPTMDSELIGTSSWSNRASFAT